MRDTWWNQSTGQRAVWLTVDCNTSLFIDTGQTVNILPVIHGLLNRNIFSIWDVVGDTAAFVGGKAACVSDFGQQSCIWGTMSYLKRSIQSFYYLTAAAYTMVNCWEAVEEWMEVAVCHTFFFTTDTFCTVFILVLTGIGVDGGWQQVCFTSILQMFEQFDVVFDQTNTSSWLNQGFALFLCLVELVGENFMFWQGFVVSDCFVQIYFFTGFPGSKNFFTDFVKFVVSQLFIFDINHFHLLPAPFS